MCVCVAWNAWAWADWHGAGQDGVLPGASGSDNWRRVWVSVAAGVTNMTQSGTVTGQGGEFVLRSHTLFPPQNQVRGCGVYLVSKASDLTASAGRGRDTCVYPESV